MPEQYFQEDLTKAINVFQDDLKRLGECDILPMYTYDPTDEGQGELEQLSSIRHKEVFVNYHGAFCERVRGDQYVAIDIDELDHIIQTEINLSAKDMLARCKSALGNL